MFRIHSFLNRQLGFSRIVDTRAHLYTGKLRYWYNDIECNGDERKIEFCAESTAGDTVTAFDTQCPWDSSLLTVQEFVEL